jgi:hypothetical protein
MHFLSLTFIPVHNICIYKNISVTLPVVTSMFMHFSQCPAHTSSNCMLYSSRQEAIHSTVPCDHHSDNQNSARHTFNVQAHTAQLWLPLQRSHLSIKSDVPCNWQYLPVAKCFSCSRSTAFTIQQSSRGAQN